MTLVHITDVEGNWKIVDYSEHPQCVGCQIEITGHGLDPNVFNVHIHVVNYLKCILEHNSTTDQWVSSDFCSTAVHGSEEAMDIEHVFRKLIASLHKLEVQDEQLLVIKTNDGEEVRFERLP